MGNLVTLLLTLLKRYWDKAAGGKSYALAIVTIAGAVLAYFAGVIPLETATAWIASGLGLFTLRHGIATEAKKAAQSTGN